MVAEQPMRPVRLEVVGVSGRAMQTFEVMFAKMGKGHGIIVNSTVSEASIIDIDSRAGRQSWHEIKARSPDRPLIVISLQDPPPETSAIFLSKPVNVARLLKTLAAIRQQLDEASSFAVQPTTAFTVAATTAALQKEPDDSHPVLEVVELAEESLEQTQILPAQVDAPIMDGLPVVDASRASSPVGSVSSPVLAKAPIPASAQQATKTPSTAKSIPVAGPQNQNQAQPAASIKLPPDYHELIGDRAEIDLADATAVEALQMNTQGYLLDVIRAASKQAESAAVRVELPGIDILLEPAANRALWAGKSDLRGGCQQVVAADTFTKTLLDSEQAAACIGQYQQPHIEQIDSLLWRLALWTYQGRLPLGTQTTVPAYLAHWPNLTRLAAIPNAMRIASLWSASSMPILHVVEALKIPQQQVFAFYGAAHALDLTGPVRRKADQMIEAAPVAEHKHRSVLSRMVNRLRGMMVS